LPPETGVVSRRHLLRSQRNAKPNNDGFVALSRSKALAGSANVVSLVD
jgi:hypothetical protein